MLQLLDEDLDKDAWPETLELDIDRIKEWRKEILKTLLHQTRELLSKQSKSPGSGNLSEDPVYLLLRNESWMN